jgi:hypothetical protein
VYDLVAGGTEIHVGGTYQIDKYVAAISLSETCTELYWEMRSLPYLLIDLHIHNFSALVVWLQQREQSQLSAVTNLILHVSIFMLKGVNEGNFQ